MSPLGWDISTSEAKPCGAARIPRSRCGHAGLKGSVRSPDVPQGAECKQGQLTVTGSLPDLLDLHPASLSFRIAGICERDEDEAEAGKNANPGTHDNPLETGPTVISLAASKPLRLKRCERTRTLEYWGADGKALKVNELPGESVGQ